MRIAFFGTSEFAAIILQELLSAQKGQNLEVACVYTAPDAVRGRGKKLEPSPVKERALNVHIACKAPTNLKDEAFIDELSAMNLDAICVASYGRILPKQVLEVVPGLCLNVHASLLPKWRGAAPIERAILLGDKKTGVCIMQMEEGLDTGAVCARGEVLIDIKNADELTEELALLGSKLLLESLERMQDGTLTWTPQETEGVLYAEKLGKSELFLQEDDLPETALRKIRAANKAHKCQIELDGVRTSIEKAHLLDADNALLQETAADILPGHVVYKAKQLLLGLKNDVIVVDELRPSGKKTLLAHEFANGKQGIKDKGILWQHVQ